MEKTPSAAAATAVFDTIPVANAAIARQGALNLLSPRFPANTWFAVYKIDRSMRLVQPFTSDPSRLEAAVRAATTGDDASRGGPRPSLQTLSDAPPRPELDGRFRRIETKVSRKGVRLRTRAGYFATPAGTPSLGAYELPLLAALGASSAPHDFSHRAAVLHFGSAGRDRDALFLGEVNLASVTLADDLAGGVFRARLAFLGFVKDEAGRAVARLGQDWPIEGPLAEKPKALAAKATLRRALMLPPGSYTLETAIEDRETGRKFGSVEAVGVQFDEVARPTLVDRGGKGDLPAKGRFFVDPARGTVVRSEVTFRLEDTIGARARAWVAADYRPEPRLGLWVPSQMHEEYEDLPGNATRVFGARSEGAARYAGFRRFSVTPEETGRVADEPAEGGGAEPKPDEPRP